MAGRGGAGEGVGACSTLSPEGREGGARGLGRTRKTPASEPPHPRFARPLPSGALHNNGKIRGGFCADAEVFVQLDQPVFPLLFLVGSCRVVGCVAGGGVEGRLRLKGLLPAMSVAAAGPPIPTIAKTDATYGLPKSPTMIAPVTHRHAATNVNI
jgi:hypothetical protein